MEFFETKKSVSRVKNNYFTIGSRPLDPLVIIDGKHLLVDKVSTKIFADSLNSTGSDGHILTATADGVLWKDPTTSSHSVTHWEEAFEENADGEITPTSSEYISDTMWILNNGGEELNLELRANHLRYNTGPEAFTEDISF